MTLSQEPMTPQLVFPKTFLVGYTTMAEGGMAEYLEATNQEAFGEVMTKTMFEEGISLGECLCSFYAKLCYASLVPERNNNISRVREIVDNIKATLAAGHGSVFEHLQLNFVTTNCSRVMTHELVRHRAGTAFSQTSGRYVRTDTLAVVNDPLLGASRNLILQHLAQTAAFYRRLEMRYGLRPPDAEYKASGEWYNPLVKDFATRKKLTSALRRFLPNGQANEIGWSVNIRQLRHMLMLRTSAGAEWEIRSVFCEVFSIMRKRFPLLVHDATVVADEKGPLFQVTGMKLQPYDSTEGTHS